MKRIFAAAAALACAGFAHADTIVYDNTSISAYNGVVLAGFTAFNSFSTGAASGSLSGVEVVLTDYNPSDGGSVAVALYADSTSCTGFGTTDCPGTFVTSLGTVLDSDIVNTQQLITVSLTSNPTLLSGTRYWLALGTSGGAEWADTVGGSGLDGTGVTGEFVADGDFPYTMTDGVTSDSATNYTPLMQVTVASAGPSVPEPGALWLFGGGLGGLLLALRRRTAVNRERL